MLITLAYVKRKLGLTNSDDDLVLTDFINARSKDFEDLESEERTEYYDGDGTSSLILRHLPITSIKAIYDDLDRVYGSDTLIDSGDYTFYTAEGIVKLDVGCFMRGIRNVKITYTAGYTEATIPEDFKLALAQFVMADYLEVKGGVNAFEGETLTYKPANLRKQAEAIWEKYRIWR